MTSDEQLDRLTIRIDTVDKAILGEVAAAHHTSAGAIVRQLVRRLLAPRTAQQATYARTVLRAAYMEHLEWANGRQGK